MCTAPDGIVNATKVRTGTYTPAALPAESDTETLLNAWGGVHISARMLAVFDISGSMAAVVPEGPHLFPEDDLTDLPDRLLAAEIVREQIFLQTHEEVPYAATVETESFKERPDGSVRIDATIYVSRAGHKAILIGDKGARIKSIGARARQDLMALLDRPVHLFLFVKVREKWGDDPERYREMGLEWTK